MFHNTRTHVEAKLLFSIFDLYTTVLLVADVYMLHHDPVRFIVVT